MLSPNWRQNPVAEGRKYRVAAKDGVTSIQNKQTGGKLAFSANGIVEVGDITEDDKASWQRLGQQNASDLQAVVRSRLQQQRRQPELS